MAERDRGQGGVRDSMTTSGRNIMNNHATPERFLRTVGRRFSLLSDDVCLTGASQRGTNTLYREHVSTLPYGRTAVYLQAPEPEERDAKNEKGREELDVSGGGHSVSCQGRQVQA
jgi:hypothetical protein